MTEPAESTKGTEPAPDAARTDTPETASWRCLSWFDCLAVAIVLIISAIVALPSLPDSICFGDFGDLQLASITLGIMHPPGYAGFVAVGHLATWVPWVDPAYMVSLACLASGLIVLWLCVMLQVRLGVNAWLAGAAALCLTTHPRMWMSMVAPEVYMPALAVLGGSVYLFVKYTRTGTRRYLLIAALLYGTALANRPPVLFALPFFLIVWWLAQRKWDRSPRAAVRSILIVTGLALLPVAFNLGYLWVRDKPDSAYNYIELYNLQWKRLPDTTEGPGARVRRVIWHVTGEQFSEYMGSTWPRAVAKLKWLRYEMFPQFERFMVVAVATLVFGVHGFFVVAMAAIALGATLAYRRCRASFLLIAGVGLSQVVFVCQYHVYGQSADVLPTYFAAVIFGGVAFSSLLCTPKVAKIVSVAVLILMVGVTINDVPNRPEFGKTSDATGWIDELDMQTLPENAVIAAGWRYWPPLRYAQIIRADRPDIHLINADARNWMTMIAPLSDRPVFFAKKFSIHNDVPMTKYRNIWRVDRNEVTPSIGTQ